MQQIAHLKLLDKMALQLPPVQLRNGLQKNPHWEAAMTTLVSAKAPPIKTPHRNPTSLELLNLPVKQQPNCVLHCVCNRIHLCKDLVKSGNMWQPFQQFKTLLIWNHHLTASCFFKTPFTSSLMHAASKTRRTYLSGFKQHQSATSNIFFVWDPCKVQHALALHKGCYGAARRITACHCQS